ncbi:MAG TPA: hypothetical protein VGD75_07360, partial [Bradyrhizobium sp.]
TFAREFVPRGLIDDLARLVIGTQLRPAPAAPVLRAIFSAILGAISGASSRLKLVLILGVALSHAFK